MDDYVAKPVSRDAFRKALSHCGALIEARRQTLPEATAPSDDLAALAAELDRGGHASSLADAQAALEKARHELERMRARGVVRPATSLTKPD
jgi:hypothetical protein